MKLAAAFWLFANLYTVEPPSWWAAPVRLLMTGPDVCKAKLEAPWPTNDATTSANCNYLFVDLKIPRNAKPGAYTLKLGTATLPFHLTTKRQPRGFTSDDVIYLAMPARFGGTFANIQARLPYLKDLGVTALWLNPIYDNVDSDYHGYHAIDFYKTENRFGTLEQWQALVDAAHQQGIKIIQDQIANHTGPKHPWVANPPTPTWFNPKANNPFQAWTLMDPYATPATQATTLNGWFVNRLPDLNQNDPEVARYLIQNAQWWIGTTGIDAIRQDTLPYVPKSFWRDWSAALKRDFPKLTLLGEAWDEDAALVSFFQKESGIDTLFDFPLYYAIRRVFAEGKPIRELAKALAHDHLYRDPSNLVTFLGLHDVPRFMHEKGATTAGLKLAFTFLMTTRGTPLIYYGDEIAMPGGPDPDNRRPFPDTTTTEQESVREHVRKFARARPRGALQNLYISDHQYVYRRGATTVAINNDTKPAHVTVEGRTIDIPARDAVIF